MNKITKQQNTKNLLLFIFLKIVTFLSHHLYMRTPFRSTSLRCTYEKRNTSGIAFPITLIVNYTVTSSEVACTICLFPCYNLWLFCEQL